MSDTVVIRPFTEGDADMLFDAVCESRAEVSQWMAWCTPGYSLEHAASFIRASIAGRATGSSYDFAVFDVHGEFAGCCGVNHINAIDKFANLGYWSRTSMTGRGVAPAAARAVAAWAFANTDLNRLEIVAAVGNLRSQRVAEKAGALREAVLRQRMIVRGTASDAVMYCLVRSTDQQR